jgi:hypothetical protein
MFNNYLQIKIARPGTGNFPPENYPQALLITPSIKAIIAMTSKI